MPPRNTKVKKNTAKLIGSSTPDPFGDPNAQPDPFFPQNNPPSAGGNPAVLPGQGFSEGEPLPPPGPVAETGGAVPVGEAITGGGFVERGDRTFILTPSQKAAVDARAGGAAAEGEQIGEASRLVQDAGAAALADVIAGGGSEQQVIEPPATAEAEGALAGLGGQVRGIEEGGLLGALTPDAQGSDIVRGGLIAGGLVAASGLVAGPLAVAAQSSRVAASGILGKMAAFSIKSLGTLAGAFGILKVAGAPATRIANVEKQLEPMGTTIDQYLGDARSAGTQKSILDAGQNIRDMEIELDRLEERVRLEDKKDFNNLIDPEGVNSAYSKINRMRSRITGAYTDLQILLRTPLTFEQEQRAIYEIELEKTAKEMGV